MVVVFAYVPFLLPHPQFLRKRILEGGCFPGNEYLLSRQLGCCVYLLALWIDSCLAALNVPAATWWRMRSSPSSKMSLEVVFGYLTGGKSQGEEAGSLSHPPQGFF